VQRPGLRFAAGDLQKPIRFPVGPTSSAAGIAEAPAPQPMSRITPPAGKERRSTVRLPCLAQKESGSLSKWSAAALYVIAAFSAGPGVPDMILIWGAPIRWSDDDLARDRSRRLNRRFDRIHNHATDRSPQP
jgi:hypothetical protein